MRLGQKLGYEVEPETLAIDQIWKQQNKTIAIEHEIRHEGISKEEIPKLMRVKADLRVLVTYVRDYQFPYKAVEMADKVALEHFQKGNELGEDEEFLLVIGTKTPKVKKGPRNFIARRSDWLAYRFHPKHTIVSDVLRTR